MGKKQKHKMACRQQAIAITLCKELQASNCIYIIHEVPLPESRATPSIAGETADQHCFEVNFA